MSLISYYGDVYQLSYVARDLEKALGFLRRKMGAEDFALREPELIVTVGGQPRPQKIRVAMANVGKMQVEVIEPVSGAVGIYTDGVDYDRSVLTFHHFGIAVPGPIANWTKMQNEVRAGGDDFALSYAYDQEAEAMVRFAYVDTRPALGHFTEYLWWAPGMAAASNAALPDLGS